MRGPIVIPEVQHKIAGANASRVEGCDDVRGGLLNCHGFATGRYIQALSADGRKTLARARPPAVL